uniref:Uncharacterized protein n=1 Tax=Utricularia reniformis TaxID=192314 RepID=A0A1Y0B0N8_9LAMI|nr:hypothetical protein AEK19_MT0717 [Utricularia reniformis]ART30963.1 hypothetical protein AEK19_MT0717 [Utricularia reniformis]
MYQISFYRPLLCVDCCYSSLGPHIVLLFPSSLPPISRKGKSIASMRLNSSRATRRKMKKFHNGGASTFLVENHVLFLLTSSNRLIGFGIL